MKDVPEKPTRPSTDSPTEEKEALRATVERFPGNLDACHGLVEMLLRYHKPSDAFEVLAQGARHCLKEGRFDDAIGLLERMLEVRPEYVQAHLEIARTHLQLGRFPKALASFGKAFDGFVDREALSRAEKVLRLMRRIDSENIAVVLREAELLVQKGDARSALEQCSQLAARLKSQEHHHEFLEVCERMLQLDPDQDHIRLEASTVLCDEAKAFINFGLFDKAIKALGRAIVFTPKRQEIYLTLADALERSDPGFEPSTLLITMAHTTEEPVSQRHLLSLARHVSRDKEHIDRLAETWGLDVHDGVDVSSYFTENESTPEPGQTQISPSSTTAGAFQRVITREHGPLINDGSEVQNLITLLRLIDQTDDAAHITLHDTEQRRRVAEFLIDRRQVPAGIRIKGQYLVDASKEGSGAQQLEQLVGLCDLIWKEIQNGHALRQPNAVVSSWQRKRLKTATAKALLEAARIATRTPLGLTIRKVEQSPLPAPLYCPTAILMTSTSLICPSLQREREVLTHDEFHLGEEQWWLKRCPNGQGYLPFHHRHPTLPSFEQVLAAREVAGELAAQLQDRCSGDREPPPLGISLTFSGGAWGVLAKGDVILFACCEQSAIGTMLNRLASLTYEGGQP